jgi:hypothetical protein
MFNLAEQLIYIAFVFFIFIVSAFSVQNETKQSVNNYNSAGLGAIRTRSSANDSKKIYNHAIVYALYCLPLTWCFL